MESKEWADTGLPPIGTVCEYLWGDDEWRKCEIVAYYFANVVAVDAFYCNAVLMQPMMFRPIKTLEQITKEERLDAIEEMYCIIRESEFKTLAALYDAGYRKTEVNK